MSATRLHPRFVHLIALGAALTCTIGGCATDDDDIDLAPACESDEKCDSGSAAGFEVFQGGDGQYYFHLVSANGQISLRSHGYTTKTSAANAVKSVRTYGRNPDKYEIKKTANGEWYVNLYAKNDVIIGTTETFTRRFDAERSLDSAVELVKAQQIRAARSGARFQAFFGTDYQSYFQLRSATGEVMLASEGYLNPAGAVEATTLVRENGKIASRYKVLKAADGQWSFHLTAANNEIIAHGETYASKSSAELVVADLVKLLSSELVADAKPAQRPARSIANYPDLVKTLEALRDITDGAEVVKHFGYAEQVPVPADAECETVPVGEIPGIFADTVKAIMIQSDTSKRPDLTSTLVASSRKQFAALLGTDSYKICTAYVQGLDSYLTSDFYLSKQPGGPRFVIELAFANGE